MPFVTVNPIIDPEDSPIFVYYLDRGSAIFKGVASPEGIVFANAGSIMTNASGQCFFKTTGLTLNTGWTQLQTGINSSVRLIQSNVNAVGNIGGGLDQLHVGTLGQGSATLQNDGDFVEIYCAGFTAANANTKRFVVGIAGLGDFGDTGLTIENGRQFAFHWRVTRITSILVRGVGFIQDDGNWSQCFNLDLAVPDLGLNSVFPQSQAESGAAVTNDIVENIFQITAFRLATI